MLVREIQNARYGLCIGKCPMCGGRAIINELVGYSHILNMHGDNLNIQIKPEDAIMCCRKLEKTYPFSLLGIKDDLKTIEKLGNRPAPAERSNEVEANMSSLYDAHIIKSAYEEFQSSPAEIFPSEESLTSLTISEVVARALEYTNNATAPSLLTARFIGPASRFDSILDTSERAEGPGGHSD